MVNPLELSRYLKSKKNTPFEWGVNDCVTLPADFIKQITGDDIISEYRGYSNEAEAENVTGGDLLEMAKFKLGEPLYNISKAQRGDIVYTEYGALGLIDDTGIKIAVLALTGLKKIPLSKGVCYWRLPCQH